jgi:hypothetical protein
MQPNNTTPKPNLTKFVMAKKVPEVEITPPPATIPEIVFIVPYRNREEHKMFFTVYMKFLLEDMPPEKYRIFFVHQCDNRPFNRGAMKNIGFLAIRAMYPNEYKNITLVFHDVDNLPYAKGLLNYETRPGVVKHFYGFAYTLGGIVSIKAGDFERTGGYPNFWAWGSEDNCFNQRVIDSRLYIDRTNFFPSGHRSMLQFVDGLIKMISKKETAAAMYRTCQDSYHTIRNLQYHFKDEYINVTSFDTPQNPNELKFDEYDIVKNNGVNRISLGPQMGLMQAPKQSPQQPQRQQSQAQPPQQSHQQQQHHQRIGMPRRR